MNGIGCIFVDRPRWKGQWVIVGGLTGKMTSKKPSCFSWKTISKKKRCVKWEVIPNIMDIAGDYVA